MCCRVLVVEDSAADRALLKRAFGAQANEHAPLHLQFCTSGVEALSLLQQEGNYADARRPDVCLMDINLPGLTGLEVLAQMKASDALRHIPVVVYSNSDRPQDVQAAYANQASSFVKKPADLQELNAFADLFTRLWTGFTRFPQTAP